MELESRIRLVRESISTITQILAERDIPVYQRGTEACVKYDARTGEPVCVMLPYLPDNASEKLIAAVQGFLDHEVGHLLYTDQKAIVAIAHDPQLLRMHNVFEDPYVERKMRQRFRGSSENFNSLFDFFLNDIVHPRFQELTEKEEVNPTIYFGALLPCIVRAWSDVDVFTRYMSDKWTHVQPILDKIPQELIDRVAVANDTQENIEIATEVLDAILKVEDELTDDPEKKEKPPSADSGDDETGDADVDPDDVDDTDGSSSEVDEDASDEGETDDEESEDEEPEDEEPEDEEPEDEEPEDEEPEDEEESDSAKPEDSESDESEEEPESETSELDEESEEPREPEESDSTPMETIADESDAEEREDPDVSSEGEQSYQVDKDELDDALLGDIESAVAPEIASMTEEALHESDYRIPTEDFDVIEEAPVLTRYRYDAKEFDHNTLEVASVMQADFEAAFVSQQRSFWRGSQYSGRINPSQLSRLRVGDPRVFRKREVHKTRDFDVQLVIDCSGSMQGSRIQLACQAAYAMAQVLDRIRINFEVIGYTTVEDVDLRSEIALDSSISWSRLDAIRMVLFKSFDEAMSPAVTERLASWSCIREYGDLCENVDGESMLIAARRLMAQKSEGKAMIVLSDGSPACMSKDYPSLTRHLRETCELIEDAGVKLFGIGIQHEGVRHYFRHHTAIHNLDDLPKAVIENLMSIMLD